MMNILLTISSAFYRQAIVLLQSLRDNNRVPITAYIVHSALTEDSIRTLRDYCAQNDIRLALIRQDDAPFKGLRISDPFPYEVYYRILAHEYLPGTQDHVLYLDTDIICDGNIEGLYDMDLDGKYLAACAQEDIFFTDPDYLAEHWDDVLAARGKYFNNGVLLINCKRFRDEQIGIHTYHDAARKMISNYVFDQGLFNYMFAREAKLIPTDQYNYRYGRAFLRSNNGETAFAHPKAKLIHFAGEISPYKPWDLVFDEQEIKKYSIGSMRHEKVPDFVVDRAINGLSKIWWSYAKRTPVYDELLLKTNTKKEWFMRGISGYLKRLAAAVSPDEEE